MVGGHRSAYRRLILASRGRPHPGGRRRSGGQALECSRSGTPRNDTSQPATSANPQYAISMPAWEVRSPRRGSLGNGKMEARACGPRGQRGRRSQSRCRPYANASDTPSSIVEAGSGSASQRGCRARPQAGQGTKVVAERNRFGTGISQKVSGARRHSEAEDEGPGAQRLHGFYELRLDDLNAHFCPALWAAQGERLVDAGQPHRPQIANGTAIRCRGGFFAGTFRGRGRRGSCRLGCQGGKGGPHGCVGGQHAVSDSGVGAVEVPQGGDELQGRENKLRARVGAGLGPVVDQAVGIELLQPFGGEGSPGAIARQRL